MSETLEPALPYHLDEQAERLMHRLCDAGLTVATAESCTGGMLAALLTDIQGAGHGFDDPRFAEPIQFTYAQVQQCFETGTTMTYSKAAHEAAVERVRVFIEKYLK